MDEIRIIKEKDKVHLILNGTDISNYILGFDMFSVDTGKVDLSLTLKPLSPSDIDMLAKKIKKIKHKNINIELKAYYLDLNEEK